MSIQKQDSFSIPQYRVRFSSEKCISRKQVCVLFFFVCLFCILYVPDHSGSSGNVWPCVRSTPSGLITLIGCLRVFLLNNRACLSDEQVQPSISWNLLHFAWRQQRPLRFLLLPMCLCTKRAKIPSFGNPNVRNTLSNSSTRQLILLSDYGA